MAAAATSLSLSELRAAAADALAWSADGDPYVFVNVVDSLEPPALILDWDDPWLAPGVGGVASMGPCLYTARLRIVCVAGRLEPGPGIEVLEGLVAFVLDRLKADPYPWPLDRVVAPGQYDLAGVTYLAAAAIYAIPTSV